MLFTPLFTAIFDVKCSLYIFFYFLDTCPSNFVFKLVFNVSCTTISRLPYHPLYGEPSEQQLPSLILKICYVFLSIHRQLCLMLISREKSHIFI